jgi:hypothetical protein
VTLFFGQRWDAPVVDDAEWRPTPVGEPCSLCDHEIEAGDQGFIRPYVYGDRHVLFAAVTAAARWARPWAIISGSAAAPAGMTYTSAVKSWCADRK